VSETRFGAQEVTAMRPHDPRKTVLHREQLESRRQALARGYWKEREASLAYVQGDPEDEIDMAVRTHTRDTFLTLGEVERHELMLVDEALRRMEEGDYGFCTACGTRIPERRLAAIPWAQACYGCQVQQEALQTGAGAEAAGAPRIESAA
jgi:DnaK suppressor protein